MGQRYGIEIRTATAADAPGLAELLRGAGWALPAPRLAERLEALRQGPGAALLAGAWGPPSGLVVLHWHPTLAADLPSAEITTLLVDPEERRRGIGRLLLKAAAQAARSAGCGDLRICAGPDAPELAAFCAATGFSEAATCRVRPLRKRA
ncbi:GNAT family N-acetyltransferase [Methylobacterium sp. A54F]